MTDDGVGGSERQWQNGFETYKDRLSAIGVWKDGYGGNHLLDYRDLGDYTDIDQEDADD